MNNDVVELPILNFALNGVQACELIADSNVESIEINNAGHINDEHSSFQSPLTSKFNYGPKVFSMTTPIKRTVNTFGQFSKKTKK